MKKGNSLFLGLITLALLSSSCSCSKRAEDGYPSNPTNGQVYRDSNGNQSTWNALMGYWMISSMMNGRQTQHYYYPSSGQYRDDRNQPVPRPAYIPAYRTASPSRSFFGGSSKSTSTTGKSGGFGSTGKSSSTAS